jgi:hypothetical protein
MFLKEEQKWTFSVVSPELRLFGPGHSRQTLGARRRQCTVSETVRRSLGAVLDLRAFALMARAAPAASETRTRTARRAAHSDHSTAGSMRFTVAWGRRSHARHH